MRVLIINGNIVTATEEWADIPTAQAAHPGATCLDGTAQGGVGWTWDGHTLTPPLAPTLTPTQQYFAALSQGVVVISASTPALNGTYTVPSSVGGAPATNTGAQANITSTETSIAAGRGLPGGGAAFNYFDASGQPHSFNTTSWGNFAAAMMNYSYALQSAYLVAESGGAWAPPSNQLSIA